ncbi:MAG: hypothetical protein HKO07_05100 [Pseudomonadales bacterium]|nr:hypothetical protein [Pseudomonadales bacterium]
MVFPEAIAGKNSVCVGIDCLWVNQAQAQELNWAGCEIIDADPDYIEVIEQLIATYSTDP